MRERPVRFVRATRALWRRSGSEVLAVLPGQAEVTRLSGSAASLWVLMDEPRSMPELVSDLADLYRAPPVDIDGPVSGCVDELAWLGLVEEVGDLDG